MQTMTGERRYDISGRVGRPMSARRIMTGAPAWHLVPAFREYRELAGSDDDAALLMRREIAGQKLGHGGPGPRVRASYSSTTAIASPWHYTGAVLAATSGVAVMTALFGMGLPVMLVAKLVGASWLKAMMIGAAAAGAVVVVDSYRGGQAIQQTGR